MVCVPAPVPGRTQGNISLSWQKINFCTGCKRRTSTHTRSSSKAVNHCQFTPGLWMFIPYELMQICLGCTSSTPLTSAWTATKTFREGRQALQRRVLLILDKPKQLRGAVCILIHLRLGLFCFPIFLCSGKMILHQGFQCCRGMRKCLGNKKLNTLFIKSKAMPMKVSCPFHIL